MKSIIQYILFFLGIAIISCAEEGDVFEEKFQEKTTVSTSLILDYVNQEFVVKNSSSSCFSIEYPITLITNTNNEVTIENNDGFKRLVASFNSNFFVTGISFPIKINTKEIKSVKEFRDLMVNCEIATFRAVTLENNTKCFEFDYPLTLIDVNGKEQSIVGLDEYNKFLIDQGIDYEPQIKYPIVAKSNSGSASLKNNFDFYRVINSCNTSCNDFTIAQKIQDQDINFRSNFEISPSTENRIESIEWFINGELQANESAKAYTTIFEEVGDYEVCAKVEFANCLQNKQICVKTAISKSQLPICKQITVMPTENTQILGQYSFSIGNDNFSSQFANSMYKWTINDELQIDFERSSFDFKFKEPGKYEICAELISNDCPNNTKACVVIDLDASQVAK